MTAAVAISNRRPRRAARENCQPGRGGLTPTKRLAVRGAGDRCAAAGRWARLWRAARSGRRRKRRGRRRGRGTLHRRYRCPNHRQVVWCLARFDLFFPALAQVGLHPDRVIFVECDKEETVLASFEAALRYGGLGAVVAELVRLPMTASRRLQLAAEKSGSLGLVIRRWRARRKPPTSACRRPRQPVGGSRCCRPSRSPCRASAGCAGWRN